MHHMIVTFALIGALGVGAQWLAWRLRLPAIVLMLAAGVLAGPIFGLIDPEHDFGDMLGPMVSIAVGLILFEGGLTLSFRELRDATEGVRRLVLIGGPLVWVLSTLAAVLILGLSPLVAAVFGGILVITGPTVVTPLLRQAKLASRPASILHWEAIVNDPVGALYAVLAFEVAAALATGVALSDAAGDLVLGIIFAGGLGIATGWGAAWAFSRGALPEYMKAPALFAGVIATFALADTVLAESGLLAVTLMGLVLGNGGRSISVFGRTAIIPHLPSYAEIRRFKEHVTVLLVSGVFIILAATLDAEMLAALDWRAIVFVAVTLLVIRPIAVFLSFIGAPLKWQEKALIGWIAPRGVVAVAVAGFFGQRLMELGYEDGAAIAPIAFAIVATTVVAHGFSIKGLARRLGLTSTEAPGVLVVGASPWAAALSKALRDKEIPALVADSNWRRLREVRRGDAPTYYGEILSETAEHHVDLNRFEYLIAASDNDAYNALVCTDFAPEFGRSNVFQVGRCEPDRADPRALPVTIGGRTLLRSGADYDGLNDRVRQGWVFVWTKLSDEFSFDDYMESRLEGTELLLVARAADQLAFSTVSGRPRASPGDMILSFAPRKSNGKDDAEASREQARTTGAEDTA